MSDKLQLRLALEFKERIHPGSLTKNYEAHVKCIRDQFMPGGALIAKTVFYLSAEGSSKEEALSKVKEYFCNELDSQMEFLNQ